MRIVCDIDGTLTDALHRADLIPADVTNILHWVAYNAAGVRDTARTSVIDLVRACYVHNDAEIILLTSRGDAVEEDTRAWMKKHKVPFDRLIMRNMNDHRPSVDYKREWLRHLMPDLLIDDCPQVCRMARDELGLTTLLINSLDPFVVNAGGAK